MFEISLLCEESAYHKFKANWTTFKRVLSSPRFRYITIPPNFQWRWIEEGNFPNLNGWLKQLPEDVLAKADLVISDNLAAILRLRPDALLMGSFLWAEILQHFNHKAKHLQLQLFIEQELELLDRIRPPMLCLADMAMPFITKFTQPIRTGWMLEPDMISYKDNQKQHDGILWSGGGTGLLDQFLANVLQRLRSIKNMPFYISQGLQSVLQPLPANVKSFSFQKEAFEQISLMLCRPGIGSITDAVGYGIPIIAVDNSDNAEMRYNGIRIEELGYGVNSVGKTEENVVEKISQLLNSDQLSTIRANLLNADRSGLAQASAHIQKLLE